MKLIDAEQVGLTDMEIIMCDGNYKKALEMLIDKIANAPTIEVPQRMRGEWIRNDNGTYSCSVCQSWIPEEQHYYARYCLYCGADMRGRQDD